MEPDTSDKAQESASNSGRHRSRRRRRSASGAVVSGATIRKQTALVLVVTSLLAGAFIGWQAATVYLGKDDMVAGSRTGAMPPGAADSSTPPLMDQAKAMEEAAAKNPNDATAWTKLGDTYFDTGLSGRAVDAYRKSLALNPNQPDVLTDMGVMLRADHKPKEALEAFEQAAKLNPKHEQSRLNMGVVLYYDMGDKAGALKAWKSLLAINPDAMTPDGKKLADEVKELEASMGKQGE